MATKTISLELDAYEKLRRAKRPGESFSGVVRRARFGPADASGATILKELDGMVVRDSDRKAADYWEGGDPKGRPASPSKWDEAGES